MINDTREACVARDGVCRFTGWRSWRLEMHEIKSRAETRGLPPEQRFNTANCVMLSPAAHMLVTRNVIGIETDEAGADGTINFVLRNPDRAEWRGFLRNPYLVPSLLRWRSEPRAA